jgi:hypothetical protein
MARGTASGQNVPIGDSDGDAGCDGDAACAEPGVAGEGGAVDAQAAMANPITTVERAKTILARRWTVAG